MELYSLPIAVHVQEPSKLAPRRSAKKPAAAGPHEKNQEAVHEKAKTHEPTPARPTGMVHSPEVVVHTPFCTMLVEITPHDLLWGQVCVPYLRDWCEIKRRLRFTVLNCKGREFVIAFAFAAYCICWHQGSLCCFIAL